MRVSRKSVALIVAVGVVVAALVWVVLLDTRSERYAIDRTMLSGWRLVMGAADDPWVIALRPPDALISSLFQQVSKKTGQHLVPPPHPGMPLVLRMEHEDALQGVYGIPDVRRMAEGVFSEATRLEPRCIGHLVDRRSESAGEFFFLAFNSPEFNDLRIELQPEFPEHAGTGIYDPGGLVPILPIGTTDKDFDRWWPNRIDETVDCQAQITVN